VAAGSGLLVLLLSHSSALYFDLILWHQGLGLVAGLVALLWLLLPAAAGSGGRWPLAAAVAVGLAGALLMGQAGALGAAVLAPVAALLVVRGVLVEDDRVGTEMTRLAATVAVTVAITQGALLEFAATAELRGGHDLHSQVGGWAAALLILWLATGRLRRLPVSRYVGLGLVAVLALAWGACTNALRPQESALAPVRVSTLAPEDGSPPVLADRGWLDTSQTCGASGCHEEIYRQWSGSPHRFAAANRFYQAAVSRLAQEERWSGVRFCAGCHDPAAVLSGTLEESWHGGESGAASEGVGCVVCHSIRKVHGSPPANGNMDLDLVPPEVGDPATLADRIRLDSRRHALSFSGNPATSTSSICKVCHRVQVGQEGDLVLKHTEPPVAGEGRDDEVCADCHLAPDRGTRRSHHMAGIGFDLGLYAIADDDELQRIAEHVEVAREQVGAFAWGPIDGAEWSAPFEGLREPAAQLLDLSVAPSLDPESGEIVLGLTTHSTARGHSFPSGPWDLQQVWLEVRVADAQGAVIHHVGGLDAAGRIEGDPLRLGALLMASDGQPIERHEILRLYSVAQRRVLAAQGEPIEDEIRLTPPEGSDPPYDLRLRWLFRRSGRDFATWALDSDEMLLPAWELVGTRLVVDHL
jgi:hypothetical protein